MGLNTYLFSICSAVYATLSALIMMQARKPANSVLATCCGIAALWAAAGAIWAFPGYEGPIGFLGLIRMLSWYCYLLYLYQRSEVGSLWQIRGFGTVAVAVLAIGLIVTFTASDSPSYTLYSWPIAIRLLICVSELLLIENLYLNLPENIRWHIALPCILLGGLACFDILVVTDSVLFRRPSNSLASAQTIAMIIVAPLLALAASRGQRWSEPVRLSRAAVFHSATLVLSGSVLLSLAIAGEILRQLDATLGWVAELSLVFSGVIGVALFLSSRSARSLLDRMVVHHFFAERYDYRAQWLNCIETLSGRTLVERTGLHRRAIQAVANVVDSPSGALFVRQNANSSMTWVSSWNMPTGTTFAPSHPLFQALSREQISVELLRNELDLLHGEPFDKLGPVWLAVPLLHSAEIIGIVVVGPPRVNFRIDQEVLDLLKILGQEVGTYIAEQRATEIILETRNLHDYGKRFAFVAHDVKNVASQLALLLSNAERHLGDPEFHRDMLETVRSSVQKIDRLLRRLDTPSSEGDAVSVEPIRRLEALLEMYRRARPATLALTHDGSEASIVISVEAFDAAMSHLINNAIESSPVGQISISVTAEAKHVVIEIIDQGDGMSPEFIRDELFSPFKTNRDGGSGIGAFQARELISEAGGELFVISRKGSGTTMRVVFRRDGSSSSIASERLALRAAGD